MIVSGSSCSARVRVPEARLGDDAKCPRCKASIAPLEKPIAVSDLAEFDALLRGSSLPVVVDFWAPWCGPCRMVGPELEKLAVSRKGRVVIAKVDTDALPELGSRYGVSSIPTIALFQGGLETRRVSGAMHAEAIARNLGV